MKKTWNNLFRSNKGFNEYRAGDRRDTLADAYFLSHTGVSLGAMAELRQSKPRTGEFRLDD
jgi:hypothetical protein